LHRRAIMTSGAWTRRGALALLVLLASVPAAAQPPSTEMPQLVPPPAPSRPIGAELADVEAALRATHLARLGRGEAVVRALELQAAAARLSRAAGGGSDEVQARAHALEAAAGRLVTAATRRDHARFAEARREVAFEADVLRGILRSSELSR
jgi:hypothetical protein